MKRLIIAAVMALCVAALIFFSSCFVKNESAELSEMAKHAARFAQSNDYTNAYNTIEKLHRRFEKDKALLELILGSLDEIEAETVYAKALAKDSLPQAYARLQSLSTIFKSTLCG